MQDSLGFTLVEVLVAILVLSVGLLGVLSTFAAVARTFDDGHASVEASVHAAELLEQLRSGGCSGATSGSRTGVPVSFTWSVNEIEPSLRQVTVVVNSARVRVRTDTFSTLIPC